MRTGTVRASLKLTTMFYLAAILGCSKIPTPPRSETKVLTMEIGPRESLAAGHAPRARDDFYEHVNASWLDNTEIPPDQSAWGPLAQLKLDTQQRLQGLIERLGSHPSDATLQKVTNLYASFMDQHRVESLGLGPIASEWARIDALQSANDIPALIGHFNLIHVPTPYAILIHQDGQDPTHYVIDVRQAGLGLPDRDLYWADESAELREDYQHHIEAMLRLAGEPEASAQGANIVALETSLARAQWNSLDSSNPVKTYNKYKLAELGKVVNNYDWPGYFDATGLTGKVNFLIVSQPSYLTAFGTLLRSTPLSVWKVYFKWKLLTAMAPYLSKNLVDEQFGFFGKRLTGTSQNTPRSVRAVLLVKELIGEALSEPFVKDYFAAERKEAVDAMVQVVLAAFRTQLKSHDWMSASAQKVVQKKLATMVLKIGAPMQYRDYDKLNFDATQLVANVNAGQVFEFQRNVAKLGKPIDRGEWKVLPQSLTPYYDPQLNEIALPAALLQAPFFDPHADEAANYGGLGVIIARAISRAFDDVGSQYDPNGRLQHWLTGQDRDRLEAKQRALNAQYDDGHAYKEVPTGGEQFDTEDVADNAALAIGYDAYRLAVKGRQPAVIDDLSGDQRYFLRFASLCRKKLRGTEGSLVNRTRTPRTRVNVSLMNQRAFATVYGLESGDPMFLALADRVGIW